MNLFSFSREKIQAFCEVKQSAGRASVLNKRLIINGPALINPSFQRGDWDARSGFSTVSTVFHFAGGFHQSFVIAPD
jgi:hypothetical protein